MKIIKKIVSIMLAISLLLTAITPSFAAVPRTEGTWIGAQYASKISTSDTDNNGQGIIVRRLTNVNDNKDSHTVFCMQHGVHFKTGVKVNGVKYTPESANMKKAAKVAFFGWYQWEQKYYHTIDGWILSRDAEWLLHKYVFTQQFIWEVLGQSNATFNNPSLQVEYEAFKNEVNDEIRKKSQRPSFNGQTISIDVGTSKRIEDTSGVLNEYNSANFTKDGIEITHKNGDNFIDVNATESCTKENVYIRDDISYENNLYKSKTEDKDTTVYFEFGDGVEDQMYSENYNDPVPLNLNLKINQYGKIELTKKDTNNKIVKGSVFNVSGNGYNQDFTTDDSGKILVEKLKKGTYTIKEKSAPYGYLLNTQTFNVNVTPSNTSKIEVIDEKPTGTFTLQKYNSNKSAKLKGATYRIWSTEYKYDKSYTTDDNGKIEVTSLKLGKYNYQETQAPDGYLIDTNTYTFEVNYKDQNTSVICASSEKTDEEPTGTIYIVKRDKETGKTAQGDATLKGATYRIYANEDIYNKAKTKKYYTKGDVVAERVTKDDGTTDEVNNLPLGKYLVKETKASKGYLLDKTEYKAELIYKDQNKKVIVNTTTSNEDVKKQQIHIFKSGINVQSGFVKGLKGAEFTIKLKTDVNEKGYDNAKAYDAVITDDNGDAYTKELPFGTYFVRETKTPKDFETAEDFTFTITKDKSEISEIAQKAQTLVVNNEQLESYIKLVKQDLKTGKNVTLNSTTFKIKAKEDIYDRGNGKLLYRKGDTIKQKVGRKTYSTFTTNADNKVIPIKSYNNTDDEKSSVVTPLTLPVGYYEIDEVKTPSGFLKLDNLVTFEIKGIAMYEKDEDGQYTKTIIIKNDKPTGTILLDKTILVRKNVDKSLINTDDLSNIEFILYAKEDIIDVTDGSTIYKKEQAINTYKTDKKGKIKIEGLPMGKYYLKETETLDGLVLNTKEYDVTFKMKNQTTKVYTENIKITNETTLVTISKNEVTGLKEIEGAELQITDDKGNVIDKWTSTHKVHTIEGLTSGKTYTLTENLAPIGYVKSSSITFKVENIKDNQKVKMIDKIVEITKTDVTGKDEIEGARLVVTDEDGNEIDKWTSSKEAHRITGLEEGKKYTLTETIAPDGYVKATSISFEVTNDKANQIINMKDKIVEISKTDLTNGGELEGAELEVIDEDGNIIDSWTSTKEPHQVKGLEEGKAYILKETTSPYGYKITEEIKFVVTTDKKTQKIEMKDMPILKNVKVIKIDSETKETIKDKFTFAIYEDQECTKLIKEVKSNKEEGIAVFDELRYGTYFIKETKAPKGYELSNRIAKVEINDKGIFVDDEQVEEKDSTIEFTFENKKIEVPKTGDESKMKLFAGAVILSLLGIAYIVIRNHNKNKQN